MADNDRDPSSLEGGPAAPPSVVFGDGRTLLLNASDGTGVLVDLDGSRTWLSPDMEHAMFTSDPSGLIATYIPQLVADQAALQLTTAGIDRVVGNMIGANLDLPEVVDVNFLGLLGAAWGIAGTTGEIIAYGYAAYKAGDWIASNVTDPAIAALEKSVASACGGAGNVDPVSGLCPGNEWGIGPSGTGGDDTLGAGATK